MTPQTSPAHDNSGPVCPLKCLPPPGEDLVRFLALETPLAAPVYWLGVVEVPITQPPPEATGNGPEMRALAARAEAGDEEAFVEIQTCSGYPGRTVGHALRSAGVNHPRERLVLMNMLAPAPFTPTGWPAAWKGRRHHEHVAAMRTLEGARNLGLRGKAALAAAETDIAANDPADLASRLGTTDHLERVGKEVIVTKKSRALGRYLPRGRALLADLGAWPWTHAERGVLPPSWWNLEAFILPFAEWQSAAYVKLRHELPEARRRLGPLSECPGREL